MKTFTFCVVALAIVAGVCGTVYFEETFDDASWEDRWVIASEFKPASEMGEWKLSAGKFYGDEDDQTGVQTGEDARFYSMSAMFDEVFDNKDSDLVFQFTVKHEQNIDCGGGYLKLIPAGTDQASFGGESAYHIMFGPDICGPGTRRTHTIFNYEGENHVLDKEVRCEFDEKTHAYTLIVHPDQTYEIKIDGESKQTGKLEDDWSFLPPRQIKDPSVSKPADWVDEEMMDDPEDTKPAGWDDIEAMIPDETAEVPEDWDEDLDGEWEAPMVPNPEYKGEWTPKRIKNPDYKGPWVHPLIDNPDFEEDDEIYHYSDIAGVGLEIWQVKAGTIFDNILVTDSVEEAEAHLETHFLAHVEAENAAYDAMKEAEAAAAAEAKAEAEAAAAAAAAEEDADEDEEDHDEL